jgi:ACS family glucarate transporter-like MFS transporter
VSAREALGKVFRVRDLWLVAMMELCVGGAAIANIGLLPETLEDRGMTSSMAGIYVSISTWVIAAFSFIGPFFSDKVGLRKPFISPFLFVSAATITFFGVLMGAPVVIAIVVYSAALGTALPLFRALIIENEHIDSSLIGSAVGLLYTINRFGAMFLPFAMGAMIDATDKYWPAFLLLAVLIAIGALFGAAVKETGWKAKKATSPNH